MTFFVLLQLERLFQKQNLSQNKVIYFPAVTTAMALLQYATKIIGQRRRSPIKNFQRGTPRVD